MSKSAPSKQNDYDLKQLYSILNIFKEVLNNITQTKQNIQIINQQ